MKVTPRHNKFIEAIADSPIHIIATMRGKDQYEIEKNESKSSRKEVYETSEFFRVMFIARVLHV